MIQIQFLDKDVVSALVPAFSMEPERVIFLYDTRIISDRSRKEVEASIKNRFPKMAVQHVRTNMLSLEDIKYELEKLVKTYENKEIHIDITGGTEIMTAAGILVAKEHNLVPIYVDFYHDQIFNVFTMEKLSDIAQVRLEDYLAAIGGEYMSSSQHTPREEDYKRILSMAKVVFSNEKKWDKFFTHMSQNGYTANGVEEFSLGRNKKDRDCSFILENFIEKGFAEKIGEDRYRFASESDKEYMTVSGIWLEMYIYIQAKQCFDEVYMGVDIDWNKSDICHNRDNEIDVVIMRKSQPIFISCKMRPVEKETVYEIYSMARRLSGGHGKSLIATTVNVRATMEEENGIYLRMAKMKVGLIESKDFIKKNPSEVFASAIRMTE